MANSLTSKRKLSEIESDSTSGGLASSLRRPVSPPLRRGAASEKAKSGTQNGNSTASKTISSPIQLSSIAGIPADCNIDTVDLRDIVGHPLIKECWAFNYLIDVDFLLGNFDADVRDQIDLKVVHGSWKKEDRNRIFIEEGVARHKNVEAITAYMPEAFGTHHSKMIITVRHDDLAQVCIFTANLIEQDWNMCQAVWISPLLPLLEVQNLPRVTDRIGTGSRFKSDLLSYLRAYNGKLQKLISNIEKFNFNSVRAALIASTPCRQKLEPSSQLGTQWGWPGLQRILKQIPCKGSTPHIVVQVSSIATLGVQDSYLRKTFFTALAHSQEQPESKPRYSIIFPTAAEIRRSVTGYACGGSIHTKIQSLPQAKQLNYLRPYLCHWAPDLRDQEHVRRAGRRRTGPHIKTYIRFCDETMSNIDWAMVTSANLSKQAWGAEVGKDEAVRICSYEIGVVFWPALWEDDLQEQVEMVPSFKKDTPDAKTDGGLSEEKQRVMVGLRMPYDLPLVPYAANEEPWCATKTYAEPDWMGRAWI